MNGWISRHIRLNVKNFHKSVKSSLKHSFYIWKMRTIVLSAWKINKTYAHSRDFVEKTKKTCYRNSFSLHPLKNNIFWYLNWVKIEQYACAWGQEYACSVWSCEISEDLRSLRFPQIFWWTQMHLWNRETNENPKRARDLKKIFFVHLNIFKTDKSRMTLLYWHPLRGVTRRA